jgi:aldehyde dehydrogenase (NAD+)
VDGQLIAKVRTSTAAYEKVVQTATAAFKTFKRCPAPRGEIVRQFGEIT